VLLGVDFSMPAPEILRTICRWNEHQLLLHPRTCLEIKKLIRKEIDDRVDVVTESCRTSFDDANVQASQHLNMVQIIYSEVADAGFLGKTLFELQVCHGVVPC